MTPEARRFLEEARVARLATADDQGRPHVVPVCFALAGDSIYIAIDRKPKRMPARGLKRLRNIAANPAVALVADHYDEDWSQLGWVMVRGRAEILDGGVEHAAAQAMVMERYSQLASMDIATLPVIAIRIEHVSQWGRLSRSD